jgi:radical SAM superfamily enzyme YgiQ (UPF0313 family)
LVTVYSHDRCTLKDVAGGFGTVFRVGTSLPARLLEAAKSRLARIPSTALGYVAAIARDAGHEACAHDVRRRAAGHDPAPRADVAVVLTSMVDAGAEREVIAEMRARGTHVIAIGAHASARPEAYLDVADVVVRGEAEAVGASLFARDRRGLLDAGFVADLDALPFPDWSAFPIASYRYALLARGGVTLPVAGVRGCAFGCGYCPFRATAPFRERTPQSVIAEVTHLVERYGARAIAFRDPLFNLDRDRVLALTAGLAPLGIQFSAEMRADRLDEPLLAELRRAGLRSLEIGVESVNRGLLAAERRAPPSHEQIERVVRWAHAARVRVIANFILGLPDDDEETMRATIAWAKRLNTFAVQFTVATPYPGTTLETRVRDRMRPGVGPEDHTGWEPLFRHDTLAPERLRDLREWAYVSYHYRPRWAMRLARTAVATLLDA